ncbi:MAG: undecaprenyl/decaprenyl-phosphate alpha-N-acetylglucosaminyl 1-phosphate transferase [Planctomycetaceae bacterium]|nr:undecaprenyl/decaprenyl-phosphate alpha-N-acetylglucosaminyl 1-phosphate transferase [Planctomycetaceae bacterium]
MALKAGLVDHPDASRKLHKKPIPVGGGVVLFCVTLLMLFGIMLLGYPYAASFLPVRRLIFPFFLASFLLVGAGLADDKWELSGKAKLFFQFTAATIVIAFAKDFSTISFFGIPVDLGHMFYPLGILWLVGIINAVNFLDGADGVCSTAGFFMSLVSAYFAMVNGHIFLVMLAVVFAGTLLGFLSCNRPPAKVYLGDTGSMLIGLVTGVLLLRTSVTENRVIHVVPALAVAVIPIFDVVLSFFRRIGSGRGLFSPDRGHIHHRFLVRFQNGYKILACLAVLFLLCGLSACLGMKYRNDWAALAAILFVPGLMILTGLFGREEVKIFVYQISGRFKQYLKKDEYEKTGEIFHFQGNAPWTVLWKDLIPSLKNTHCVKVQLDINMPSLHENYVSRWERKSKTEMRFCCVLPLICGDRKTGTLEMTFDTRKTSNIEAFKIIHEISVFCMKYIEDYIQLREQANGTTVFSSSEGGFLKEEEPVSREPFQSVPPSVPEAVLSRFDSAVLSDNQKHDVKLHVKH